VAKTAENPPQAQLIGQRDAIQLTPGTTSIRVSVAPVDPPSLAPTGGAISGNVYRLSVTDQAGNPLAIKPCDGCVSMVLRAPDGIGEATLGRYTGSVWQTVETIHAGMIGLYQANPKAFGDYALVVAVEEPQGGPDATVIVAVTALLVLLAGGAFLLFRVRQAPPAPPTSRSSRGGIPSRVPSKRRGPRSIPSKGRSNR
jgi:hypothetical protein